MIKLVDKIKGIIYRALRSGAYTTYNACYKCKKRRRNDWTDIVLSTNHLLGYDKILDEWIMIRDSNMYAKVWVMNGYITDIRELTEELWNTIRPLCRKCIGEHLKHN
jgi:hypothetical protein